MNKNKLWMTDTLSSGILSLSACVTILYQPFITDLRIGFGQILHKFTARCLYMMRKPSLPSRLAVRSDCVTMLQYFTSRSLQT
jgi:hypothetical protein